MKDSDVFYILVACAMVAISLPSLLSRKAKQILTEKFYKSQENMKPVERHVRLTDLDFGWSRTGTFSTSQSLDRISKIEGPYREADFLWRMDDPQLKITFANIPALHLYHHDEHMLRRWRSSIANAAYLFCNERKLKRETDQWRQILFSWQEPLPTIPIRPPRLELPLTRAFYNILAVFCLVPAFTLLLVGTPLGLPNFICFLPALLAYPTWRSWTKA